MHLKAVQWADPPEIINILDETSMKTYNFDNFNGNFASLKGFRILSNFSRKFRQKFRIVHVYGVLAIYVKFKAKTQWKTAHFG